MHNVLKALEDVVAGSAESLRATATAAPAVRELFLPTPVTVELLIAPAAPAFASVAATQRTSAARRECSFAEMPKALLPVPLLIRVQHLKTPF
jgi:hypothetical protein